MVLFFYVLKLNNNKNHTIYYYQAPHINNNSYLCKKFGTMEITDLQIGDWIYVNPWDDQEPTYPNRVTAIEYNSWEGKDYCDWVNCEVWDEINLDKIRPIPINDDILSQNGWERTGGASHRIYGDYNAVIFHWNENRKEIIIDKNGERHYMLKLDLLYVHELQHALRICGIEQDIIIKTKED